MADRRLASSLGLLILLGTQAPPFARSDDPTPPRPAGERADAGLLTISGTVLSPDGSPAARATVEAAEEPPDRPIIARADGQGRFRLRGVFGNRISLHAASADGAERATRSIPAAAARTAFAAPVELRLAPAVAHGVAVTSGGRPAGGVHVVASGTGFEVRGHTGEDGKAELQLPAGERLGGVVAWHPELGVAGVRDLEGHPHRGATRLSLLPPGPHRILVVDPEGEPVEGLELGVNVRTGDSGWILAAAIEAARVRTDAEGAATVGWTPRDDLRHVEVKVAGPGWKVDRIDPGRPGDGLTTVHARREIAVGGRVVLPEGVDAEGLLVTGFGFGPEDNGDIPYARAGGDGRFTLRVPSDHAYVLGVADLEWASDVWSGLVLGAEGGEPADVTLEAYPATPLAVRVTRGPDRAPVAGAWVNLSSRGDVGWVDARGEKRAGTAGVRGWLWTDADGRARTGVGRGEVELRLSSGAWVEGRTIEVASGEPIEVEFHRAWRGDRRVAGRLVAGGGRYTPSPSVAARAFSPRTSPPPLEFDLEVRPDGTFEVAFDAEALEVLVLDPDRRRGGFARIGPGDSGVDLAMEPMASYGGVLVDGGGRPLPDRGVRLSVASAPLGSIVARRTDEAGRFRFAGVPAGVPLRLDLEVEGEGEAAGYDLFGVERLFEPGEAREGDRVTARQGDAADAAGPPTPLADRVREMCRDVRAGGMRGLVILMGDGSPGVVAAAGRLLDPDEVPPVLGFLGLRLEADRVEAEALAGFGWPRPGPGELVLVALGGDRETIATRRIEASPASRVAAAVAAGAEFLGRHGPPPRDAMAELAEARRSARASGRRVWVVLGGPRCAPCFRLARWMDARHATLEEDYVVVKVMGGLDENAPEVAAQFPDSAGEGIPWFAITEPDGTVLATSEGPLGNIGFPGSLEGRRHLRQMLGRTSRTLTPDEIEGLVDSLASER